MPSLELARKRHAEHFRNVLASAQRDYLKGGGATNRGLVNYDFDEANISLGFAWASDQSTASPDKLALCSLFPISGDILRVRQDINQRIDWIQKGLAASIAINDGALAGSHLANLAIAASDRGDHIAAIESYEQALAYFRAVGDIKNETIAHKNLAHLYHILGDRDKAAASLAAALSLLPQLNDRDLEISILNESGNDAVALGDSGLALERFYNALHLCDLASNIRYRITILNNISRLELDNKNIAEAKKHSEEALTFARSLNDRRQEGQSLLGLASVLADSNQPDRAIGAGEEALTIFRDLKDDHNAAAALNNIGTYYQRVGDHHNALRYFRLTLDSFKQSGFLEGVAKAHLNIGKIHVRLNSALEAVPYLTVAAKHLRRLDDKPLLCQCLDSLAACAIASHDSDSEISLRKELASLYHERTLAAEEGTELGLIASLYDKAGDDPHYIEYQRRALSVFEEAGVENGIRSASHNLGRAYLKMKMAAKSIDEFERSLSLSENGKDPLVEVLSLLHLGIANRELRQFEPAIGYYLRAAGKANQSKMPKEEAKALADVGEVYLILMQYENAERVFRPAATLYNELNDKSSAGASLINLAMVSNSLGKNSAAETAAAEALADFQDVGDEFRVAHALTVQGSIFLDMYRAQEAIQVFQRAQDMFMKLGNLQREGSAISGLAIIHRQIGQFDEALQHHPVALDRFQQIEHTFLQANELLNWGVTLHRAGKIELARRKLNEALSMAGRVDESLVKRALQAIRALDPSH
jgi:tetratricopeptide (TPR) repeat protein